ncbi:transmembrane protein [Mycobacteroides abscessus subsp. abscessus]|nr:transmembrane protein [Mycobacteroides abscessus subsp. abscessus]
MSETNTDETTSTDIDDAKVESVATELVDGAEKPSLVEGDLADPLAVPIDGAESRDGLDTATFTAFSAFKDDDEEVTGRIDTDALPLTEAFDVGSDRTGAMPVTSAESMTPDPLTGAVPVVADEPAKPVRVPAEREPAFLKRWVLLLILLAAWIPAGAIGLLLYQHWFESMLPYDRVISVAYVLGWVFACVLVALLLAVVEPRPIVVALAFAILTAPAISVAAAGAKYGYVACTAPDIPGVASLCPEPLRTWGIQYRDRA